MQALRIETARGAEVLRHIDDLARLRIEVFREFPYLYEGTLDYEQRYLQSYARSQHAVVVLVHADDQVVGASTAMPLLEHGEDLGPKFAAAHIAPENVFYFGESVLKAPYRRRGIGNVFFEQREAAARAFGARFCAFCAVSRPDDHPLRPPDYVPHDTFWRRRGYDKSAALTTTFSWPDLGELHASAKTMVFWLKELSS